MSQEALALDAGVDRTYVSRLERELENPTVIVLERLATTLGVPVAALFAFPEPNEQQPKALRGGRRRQQPANPKELK